ncbi:alpha/beta hydrolase [Bacillus kwashiorkori]|uniref:alpha/beta hydrolase n=1 Tax=Bacillus kwashiorkori TaxID=1522318 RepID=UPI0007827734|nr:carboxylesterase [Bacillus kwashiorkori]
MKVVAPKPFTFKGGKRAVLLLHGFTGTSADVRMLGRFLEKHGYTSHAPLYRGHGVPPEELLKYNPDDWWEDVLEGYQLLKDMGHEEIAVAGLSLGAIFTLKLAYNEHVKGIVPMCAPMFFRSEDALYKGVLYFAREYKKKEGKDQEQIDKEMLLFDSTQLQDRLKENQALVTEVKDSIDMIYAPIFVVQARKDVMVNPESANIIYNEVESDEKSIKFYEESGHVVTVDKERDQLHEDVLQFLNSLDWKE